jgi:hypothetical protein
VARAASDREPTVLDALRRDALAGDWAGWVKAWEQLDAGPLAGLLARARAGDAVALVLCGERGARWFASAHQPPGWLARLHAKLQPPRIEMLTAGL